MGDRLWADKPPRFVTSNSGQLSLLLSGGRIMSTGQSAATLRGWRVKYGPFHIRINVWVAGKTVCSLVTTCQPELFRDESCMIKRYTNLRLLTYFLLLRSVRSFTLAIILCRRLDPWAWRPWRSEDPVQ